MRVAKMRVSWMEQQIPGEIISRLDLGAFEKPRELIFSEFVGDDGDREAEPGDIGLWRDLGNAEQIGVLREKRSICVEMRLSQLMDPVASTAATMSVQNATNAANAKPTRLAAGAMIARGAMPTRNK